MLKRFHFTINPIVTQRDDISSRADDSQRFGESEGKIQCNNRVNWQEHVQYSEAYGGKGK